MKKYLLILDTSSVTGLCAIAEKDSRKIISSKYINAKSSHSEHLFLSIEETLSENKLDFSNIDTVVYTAGPGSFTGLRIAYSAVKGFTMATGVKSHGVSTLKALIHNIKIFDGYKAVLVKGSANDVYVLIEDENCNVLIKEDCYEMDKILSMIKKICSLGKRITCIGSGALFYKDLLINESEDISIPTEEAINLVSPEGMLSLLEQKSIDDINYLKASYAEIKQNKNEADKK
ncbi:MAG: tRNA (adenosine(37)-N6)-threonylcarbamoyltransferase complex dimerization subunit type 1 TsaB [bacterium]